MARSLTSYVWGQKKVAPWLKRKVALGRWQFSMESEVGRTRWLWCVGPKLQGEAAVATVAVVASVNIVAVRA